MSHVAKRTQVAHLHSKRTKIPHKIMTLHPKFLNKPQIETVNEENSVIPIVEKKKFVIKAKVPQTGKPFSSRTLVCQRMRLRMEWRRKFKTNQFFRFRVISRRYLRKLSMSSQNIDSASGNRKVSWGDEIEYLCFDAADEVDSIQNCPKFKENITTIMAN